MKTSLLMSYEQYSEMNHSVPYKYILGRDNQFLYFFGSQHTYDQNNPQFSELENFWNDFKLKTTGKNRIVLTEGGVRPVRRSIDESISKDGEMGFLTFLANNIDISVFSPEIPDKILFNKLAETFSKEEVAYWDFARICYQWNQMAEKPDFIPYVQGFLDDNTRNVKWDDFIFSLPHMISIHKKLFGTAFNENEKDFFYSIINPTINRTVINRISRDEETDIREIHILQEIERYWSEGQNIFILYGSSHAVRQEAALREVVKK